MLSAAKHLDAQRDRPFAAAQGDTRKPFQGGGKPRPYYTQAWKADLQYSRGVPLRPPWGGAGLVQRMISLRL